MNKILCFCGQEVELIETYRYADRDWARVQSVNGERIFRTADYTGGVHYSEIGSLPIGCLRDPNNKVDEVMV